MPPAGPRCACPRPRRPRATLPRDLAPARLPGVAGAWLAALTGRERRFAATDTDRARLADELAAWQRDAAGGAVRALFRLVEPAPDELKVVSSFKLPPPNVSSYPQSWPHPVIANGKLYIRDQNVLYCYNVKA